jgi:tRNA(Ile)-lysidine synthase
MLTPEVFFQRAEKDLSAFSDSKAILIAVSGGPDSMALLRLAHQWGRAAGRPKLYAATVDHGLRPDSQDEARQVGEWCAPLGIPHRILCWDGQKPEARLQERARDARYALLEDFARETGCDTLLTAHHAGDQAETILFRMTRGSGLRGLAGMARSSRRGALRHGRPLLDWSKAELVGVCDALGQPFFRDPSNHNPRFARTRMRQLLEELEPQGLGAATFLRLSERARRADDALETIARSAAARYRLPSSADRTMLDARGLAGEPEEIVLRILGREIAALSPKSDHLRYERLERLTAAFLAAQHAVEPFAATLADVMVSASPGKAVVLRLAPTRKAPEGN